MRRKNQSRNGCKSKWEKEKEARAKLARKKEV